MTDENLESAIAENIKNAEEYEMMRSLPPGSENDRPSRFLTPPSASEAAAMFYYQAAELLWENGRQEEAGPLLDKVFALQPDHEFAHRLLGRYPPTGGQEPPSGYRSGLGPRPTRPPDLSEGKSLE